MRVLGEMHSSAQRQAHAEGQRRAGRAGWLCSSPALAPPPPRPRPALAPRPRAPPPPRYRERAAAGLRRRRRSRAGAVGRLISAGRGRCRWAEAREEPPAARRRLDAKASGWLCRGNDAGGLLRHSRCGRFSPGRARRLPGESRLAPLPFLPGPDAQQRP